MYRVLLSRSSSGAVVKRQLTVPLTEATGHKTGVDLLQKVINYLAFLMVTLFRWLVGTVPNPSMCHM